MIYEPKQQDIDHAFEGTNFGPQGETPDGRKDIVADCVLKRACGFASGGTIEHICRELSLLTKARNPTKRAKQWAYCHLHVAR